MYTSLSLSLVLVYVMDFAVSRSTYGRIIYLNSNGGFIWMFDFLNMHLKGS